MSEIDSLAEAIGTAYDRPESDWPTIKRQQLSQEQSATLNTVLSLLREKADDLGISQGMLCNRKDAEKLVLGRRNLQVLSGWRADVVGAALLQLLPDSA